MTQERALSIRTSVRSNMVGQVLSVKHGGPGPGAPAHVPLHALSPGAPVRITEGELKADVATMLSGVLTIAVPGVSVWRQALPVLEVLQPTRVLVSFDSDWRQNQHVACALTQSIQALVETGYTVGVETWDVSQGKGIDDVLAAGYRPVLQSVASWLRGQGDSSPSPSTATPYQRRFAAGVARYQRQIYADPYLGAQERRAKGIPAAVLMYEEAHHD